jgi:hypothetical protein
VTLQADIKGMFNAVKVNQKDAFAFCYYLRKNNNLDNELELHQMLTQVFGAASSPGASTFALRKAAGDNKDHFDESVISTVYRDFYVDDLLKSLSGENDAIKILTQLRELLLKGSSICIKLFPTLQK